MRSPRLLVAAGALAAALSGCQDPDVGQKCTVDLNVDRTIVAADYLETGKTDCENLVCILSPDPKSESKNREYCSKACVSNADCSESDTGLVCRPVVLDANFINTLDPTVRQRYLGDITLSNYCAPPLP
ncbi:MAG: adventurous gliding motility lipoprotein CglC [Anaeromyxobacteraceae bacterium]